MKRKYTEDVEDGTAQIQKAGATRRLELRSTSVLSDYASGAPGTPFGSFKTSSTGVPLYTLPLLHARRPTIMTFDGAIVKATQRNPCLAPMLTQFTNQCYVAAALNTLMAAPDFRELMHWVFKDAQEKMPDAFADILGSPLSHTLPLGVLLLKVMYNQYHLAEFEPSLVAAVIEECMVGTTSSTGGFPEVALCTMLSALGLSCVVEDATDPRRRHDPSVAFVIVRHFNGDGKPPTVIQGRKCVGAVVSMINHDDIDDIGHVVAALDCDIVFDSLMSEPPVEVPWRARKLADTIPPDRSFTQAAVVYMSAARNISKDRVLVACFGTHRIDAVTTAVTRGSHATHAMMSLDISPMGALHGNYIVHTPSKVIASWYRHGELHREAVDWPAMVVASKRRASVTFVWPGRVPPLPQILKLRHGPPATFSYQMRADPSVEGKVIRPMTELDASWLPFLDSVPDVILDAHPWLHGILVVRSRFSD